MTISSQTATFSATYKVEDMRNDNEGFYRAFSSLSVARQAQVLRDTAQFYREQRGKPQDLKQADDLEHEAFLIENWGKITEGAI